MLVGVDLGTTACRALAFDQDLRLLCGASRPLPLLARSGTEIEQDAREWWKAAASAVREAVAGSGGDARQVRGIGVCSQGISFVPVDGRGLPLRSAFSWLDTRALSERRTVVGALGERRVFSITGKRCSEAYVLPKLLWLRGNEPATWAKTRRILMPLDFLLARLTGEPVTDPTMASGTMLYDVTRGRWSPRILETFDLDPSLLPVVRQSVEIAGALRAAAAGELGLPAGIPIAVGGQDQKVAALGAGLDLDRCTISLGTAMAITRACDRPLIDPAMRVPCFADLLPGRWVIEGSSVCCSVLDWAKRVFFPDADWPEVDRRVEEAEALPNAPLLLPFFSGAAAPFFDPAARGTLSGLDLSTTPAQIVRSVCEGVAFLIRANLEMMEDIAGPVGSLRIFGGGSRSDLWCRIIADTVQRPVTAMATVESASVGAAILAGIAGGVFGTPRDAFPLLAVRGSYDPRPGRAAACDEAYGRFRSLAGRVSERAPRVRMGPASRKAVSRKAARRRSP